MMQHPSPAPSDGPPSASRVQARMPLGLLLGGAAFVFVFTITLLAYMGNQRNEASMARLLGEKGSSLIAALEGGLRSGKRSRAGIRLQVLLEEMARSPGIIFVALTMPDGTILAHSDRTRLGEIVHLDGAEMDTARMEALRPNDQAQWGLMYMEDQRAFVVYRQFSLGASSVSASLPMPVIFLGLDVSPFEITRNQNRAYLTMLTVALLLVGLVCLLALYYAERARQWRRGQYRAEGKVRRLEEEVRRAEKLAAIGNLAAGVAHEIRNPLSSIKGYATYFGQRFPEGSADREAAHVMVNEVDRLNRVITDLIGLSRPSDIRPRPVQLEEVLQHTVQLVRHDAEKRGVRIVCRCARRLPAVLADPERIEQVLLNLCLNALDSMPQGGALTLAITRHRQGIYLWVRDNGTGIAPDAMPHIFDPYFTSKAHGTGLGLAMVHKIIEAHHGEIHVESRLAGTARPGKTVFRIWLAAALKETPSGDVRQRDAKGDSLG